VRTVVAGDLGGAGGGGAVVIKVGDDALVGGSALGANNGTGTASLAVVVHVREAILVERGGGRRGDGDGGGGARGGDHGGGGTGEHRSGADGRTLVPFAGLDVSKARWERRLDTSERK